MGSGSEVHPSLRSLPTKSCFPIHRLWAREVKKRKKDACGSLATSWFPVALGALPMPLPTSQCTLGPLLLVLRLFLLWEAARATCRSSLEVAES